MTFHIVRMNEKIEKIALNYQLDIDEIKEANQYIRDWNHLIPGTKLRLPEISASLNEEIDQDEPFIEEYYPKLNENNYYIEEKVAEKGEPIVDSEQPLKQINESVPPTKNQMVKQEMIIPNYPNYYLHPNYYYPYPYMMYQTRNLRKPIKRKKC